MSYNTKSYLLVLLITFIHVNTYASVKEKRNPESDKEFFETAASETLSPQKKHEKLSTLIKDKANIAVAGPAATIGAFSGATALYNMIQVAGARQRDHTQSIKLLIDNKSPLHTQNNELSVLERAINHEMISTIQMLVDAKANLQEQLFPGGENCLHQIADPLFSNDNNACIIFDILKQHGNLPVDNVTLYGTPGFTAVHLSNHQTKPKKQLLCQLLAHGANPYCPAENCPGCHRRYNRKARDIHKKWKKEAQCRVLEKIPIKDIKKIIIDYCFWNPRNKKT